MFITVLAGCLGVAVGWILAARKISALRMRAIILQEKLSASEQAHQKFSDAFRAISSDALERNNRSFLNLATATLEKFQEAAKGDLEKRQEAIGHLVLPVKETLTKLGEGMQKLEKERKGDHEALKEQMRALVETEKQLRDETGALVKVLRSPIARGRWGEIQLKRVVELAGMLSHCDFYEQSDHLCEEVRLRPDLVVRLPGGRQVVIDAKTPLDAYLEAAETSDELLRTSKLKEHARQVRAHMTQLGKKAYWERFQPTPEFVVLFLPSETFFSAALEQDPSLIEVGVEEGVILATPTTLIALLRAVAYGWKQENLSRHAEEVSELGHELYKRIIDMGNHWAKMGRSLASAVESYNKAVGSLESRVLASARKFKEMGAASSTLDEEELLVIEKTPRQVQSSEMNES